ncbi:MAG: FecR domain-containing protein [Rhodocyclaceae bacterium]|nr:FecR domain-containing protein [Rhodocyclaceae bacterium]
MKTVLLAAACAFFAPLAAAGCDDPVGRLLSAEGVVERRGADDGPWQRIEPPAEVCRGDRVTVRPPGRAAVQLQDGSLLRLDENTTLHLLAVSRDTQTELGLIEGFLHVITRMRKNFSVTTPFVNALVEGTEFSVASQPGHAQVVVESGTVRTENPHGSMLLPAGAGVEAVATDGPRRIEVRPLDALRWAIHYPQIVWHGEAELAARPAAEARVLREVQAKMVKARYAEALDLLERSGPNATASANTRISLLLALGRVDDAIASLGRRADADDATAIALDAIMRVARHQPRAFESAQAAVAAGGDSAAAHLALSYARQARGELEDALAAAREATRRSPQNPFAWTRRAELELSLTLASEARRSLAQAGTLAPDFPRGKTLLGFAEMIAGAIDTARDMFADALAADATDPLAYFGRGLAAVRSGDDEAGRRDIERAVLLDPGNAELRAYLARVYVEEDRGALAAKELELARRLDPASPTPWQFDALRKLRDNDPAGALVDGRRAIARNDNRAVIRTPRLLDIDRAMRSANLAAAYSAMGFENALRVTAIDTLMDDPASPAGHRLLADAHAETPRGEAARLGALLQARLREPIGRTPLPPQLDTRATPLVGGPRVLSPEDTSDLFERGPNHFFASAQAGTQATRGASILASRAGARGQIALGHFAYRRDAIGESRDIDLTATRLDGRLAIDADTVLIGEVASGDRRGGETVPQLLAGIGLMPIRIEQQAQRDAARISLRRAMGLDTELIVTGGVQGIREKSFDRVTLPSPLPLGPQGPFAERFDTDLSTRLHSREFGLSFARQRPGHRLQAGLATYRQDSRTTNAPTLCCQSGTEPIVLQPPDTDRSEIEHNRLFASLALEPSRQATIFVGATHDTLSGPSGVDRLNGKLGARLQVDSATTIGAAVIQGVKGPKYREQAVEPPQFAGFDQVFDDIEGTRWRLDAAEIDHRLANGGIVGAVWSRRRLDVPGLGCDQGDPCLGDWNESRHRAYLEWPLGDRAAATLAWQFERQQFDGNRANLTTLPHYLRTELVPIGLWLKPARHWTLLLEALRVRQRASVFDESADASESRNADHWLANARIGFVGRARRIEASLAIHNLFDQALAFQNADLNRDPQVPLFYAERSVVLQASVRF